MKNLNVYIIAGKHPLYEAQIKYPPNNVRYINWFGGPNQSDFDKLQVYSKHFDLIRTTALKSFKLLRLPATYLIKNVVFFNKSEN